MAKSVELKAQRATLWERAKELNDAAEAESRALSAEEQTNWDKAMDDIAALDARIQRAEALEKAPADERQAGPLERPTGADPETRGGPTDEQRLNATFEKWLRHGQSTLDVDERAIMQARYQTLTPEQRALSAAVDTAGGYFVPEGFMNRIASGMKAYGGMLEVAESFSTDTGNDLPMPTDNDTGNVGERIGENQQVSEQDVTIGQRVFKAHAYSSKMVKVSLVLLQDSAFGIEDWLAGKLSERIARKLNADFTTGQGADGPKGIVVDAVSGVTAAATGAVTSDELIDLVYSVDRSYRSSGRFMMHDQTLRDIRKLKDGDGRYIWVPGLTAGQSDTLLSYSVVTNNDLATMATGVKSVLFGDLKKYMIRNVRGFQLLTLRERYAEFLQVAFIGFSRHDGMLIDPGTNPVKAITQA
jgi:HK97 family phage major capsid protein